MGKAKKILEKIKRTNRKYFKKYYDMK